MLVLSRKLNEGFKIGDEITVKILSRHGNQIRIGIDAPKETKILREELLDRPAPPEAA